MSNHRLLLCWPASGLLDIFSQIGLAIAYARRYRRIVIVDTNPPDAVFFRDSFSNYFVSLRDDLVLDIRNHAELLDRLPVVPKAVAGRINSYRAIHDTERGWYLDEASGAILSFDFSRDYEEAVLVDQGGGRSRHLALLALTNMRLRDRVRDEVDRRLASIGGAFKALHIRATDYQTDYRSGIDRIRDKLVGKLFVATDNRAALAYVQEQCVGAEIHSFAHLPEQAGQPLHVRPDPDMIWQTNLDAIADVLVLAHAQGLYSFRLNPNEHGLKLSGYSVLAKELMARPALLKQLMLRA